jgi:monoamine oxidase
MDHVVNKVTSTGENSSTVSCSNGKTFTADKVVIAVPLGVLKKNAITFSPALPDWKVEAISKLRMGNVCKVLIVPKRNLSMEATSQTIAVVSEDIEKRGAATFFVNIAALASVPAYMTFGLGPNSDEIEKMPEADLKNLIARRMNAFTSIATSEFDIVKSTWRGNPNIGGAYTYSGLGAPREHWEDMARPIFENGWYFCG